MTRIDSDWLDDCKLIALGGNNQVCISPSVKTIKKALFSVEH